MDTNATQASNAGTAVENRIRETQDFGTITVARVYASPYQKEGTLTAELKQTVTTKSYYPSKSVSSSLQDNMFGQEDFGFTEQEFISTSTRVAWIDVPANSTPETVAAQLAKFPEARIMRILSNRPILSDNQAYGVKQGLTTVDAIGDSQVVRYSDTNENEALRGKLTFDREGKVQYKGNYFRTTKVADEDRRTTDRADMYVTPTIAAEIAAMPGNVPAAQGAPSNNDGLFVNNSQQPQGN